MDLRTTYLGLNLKNPLVPSSGPFSHSLDSLKRLEDAGASAIVMYSVFEEQLMQEAAELDHHLMAGTESTSEAVSYFPTQEKFNLGPDEYLEHIQKAKKSLKIPIIASLNGTTPGGWIKYAEKLQEAGADAIELNVYYLPSDPKITGLDIETRYIESFLTVKRSVKIPISMKLNPFFSSLINLVSKLDQLDVDGLVLFNRFYQPDIILDTLEIEPLVVLSSSHSLKLPLRWIGILYGKVKANIAASGGIHNFSDALKMIMVGADVTMMCSAIIKNGPKIITETIEGMKNWMEEHEYESIKQMKGSMSQKSAADPSAFERANYMKSLRSYK
jgi:dihydroorotate dehydrogenase (fumarate)